MPTGVYKRTKKHRKILSEAQKRIGNKPPSWKGIKRGKQSEEHKRKNIESHKKNGSYKWTEYSKKKLSKSLLGHSTSDETRKKIGDIWRGKKFSEAHKIKLSLARKGKPNLKMRGKKCNFWKGGITPINAKIKNSIEYRLWREAVFARDNWTCQKTGIKGGKLQAHHINNFADFPKLRFAIDNGITLSKETHEDFHKIYGKRNNTKEQLEEFLTTK